MNIILYGLVFIFGIIFGSFLNVCIYRIPRHSSLITHSHCMNCGYHLAWYDLVPILSYLFLKGKCRKCGSKISIQYPLVEIMNGILWITIFYFYGFQYKSILYCLFISTLLVISVIDFRTYEIPPIFNGFIGVLGVIQIVCDPTNWLQYIIGFFCISILLLLLYYASKGRAIGGGDVKLMAVSGLLIGGKLIFVAFLMGCIFGSIIHSIRMKVSGEGKVLAMGPYLSAGILFAILFGNRLIDWYMTKCLLG